MLLQRLKKSSCSWTKHDPNNDWCSKGNWSCNPRASWKFDGILEFNFKRLVDDFEVEKTSIEEATTT